MYYQSSESKEPHLIFVGRWHPFHDGHKSLILEGMKLRPNHPVMILVRDTSFDEAPANVRAGKVIEWLLENDIKGCVLVIPDVKGVYYGRGVGYEVLQIELEAKTQKISGTSIREGKTVKEIYSD